MKNTITLSATLSETAHKTRLDAALSRCFTDYSRNQMQQWIKQGNVTVNGSPVLKTKTLVATGDHITITATLSEVVTYQGQDIPLAIIYEDEDLLVINKPVGLIVHPGAGNPDQTLVNALLHYCPALINIPRAGVVHRLDKDTSGLLVVAKTLPAHHALIKAMQRHDVHREYRALVQGQMISGGTIDAPIGRHATQRIKMAVTESGREAITHYRVLSRFAAHTLLSVQLETGRTHQIRVHLAHIGYPIVGDKTYGKHRLYAQLSKEMTETLRVFNHQALHAYRLGLTHPITQEKLEWTAPMPDDFEQLLAFLKKESQK